MLNILSNKDFFALGSPLRYLQTYLLSFINISFLAQSIAFFCNIPHNVAKNIFSPPHTYHMHNSNRPTQENVT